MMTLSNLLVLLINHYFWSVYVNAEVVTTTTRTYDVDIPGSSSVRIIEGESLWGKDTTSKPSSRFDRRSLTTAASTTNLNNPLSAEGDSDKAEFSDSALRDFLNSYSEKVKEKPVKHVPDVDENKGKKSWSQLQLREHNHPYDDKEGWVTLQPVPWSVSKISKWHNKPKPVDRWDSYPSNNNDYDYPNENLPPRRKPVQQSNYQYNNKPEPSEYQVYYVNEKKPVVGPTFSKPSAIYGQTVHLHASTNSHRNPIKINNYYKHDDCNKNENVAIITDGRPPNFPTSHYDSNRRIGTELQPESHPFMSEGEWILLSTTKGYKLPQSKQRSSEVNPDLVGTHRTVRLTVLPPLKGSKVNITTSHGGLLQVEHTSETVEQAQKKFSNQKLKRPVKLAKKKKPFREITSSTIATIPKNTGADSSAVLAGVGAGIIPATMAMLVPIAMNGRRRKRRELSPYSTSSVEITLPRYIK